MSSKFNFYKSNADEECCEIPRQSANCHIFESINDDKKNIAEAEAKNKNLFLCNSSTVETLTPPMKRQALYCTPLFKIPGTITFHSAGLSLQFEPNVDNKEVRLKGIGAYQVYVDVRDLLECGAITVPNDVTQKTARNDTQQELAKISDSEAYHFLQLQLTTLHGKNQHLARTLDNKQKSSKIKKRYYRCDGDGYYQDHNIDDCSVEATVDDKTIKKVIPSTNVLMFQALSRKDLHEITRSIIEAIDALKKNGEMIVTSTLTSVPFGCSSTVEELSKFGLNNSISPIAISTPCLASESDPNLHIHETDQAAIDYLADHDKTVDTHPWLLTRAAAATLTEYLPLSLKFHKWVLGYSPRIHGISLQHFYRQMEEMNAGPSILLVRDTSDEVFGALCMHRWTPNRKFVGSGESFVFSFEGNFEEQRITVYPWSSENEYFQYADGQRLVIGGGGPLGQHSICLFDQWLRGSTGFCMTYNSEPLTRRNSSKSGEIDFIVNEVEVWNLKTCET